MAAPREPAVPVKGFELKLLASENGRKDWSSHWMFQKRRKRSKSTASPHSYAYKKIRLQQGTLCVKEPFLLPQGTVCLGYRYRWGWYGDALVQDRLDRIRRRLSRPPPLPRRHDWCRPCYQSPCKCREACRKALPLCKGRNPRSDEREHFPLQEQLIIHMQPLGNLG